MAIFGDTSEQAIIEVVLEAKQAIKEAEELKEEIARLKKQVDDSGNTWGVWAKRIITANEALNLLNKVASGASFVVGTLVSNVGRFISAGDKLADMQGSFEALGGSSQAIEQASQAVLGVVSGVDLMNVANKALVAELPLVNEKFSLLADYGKKVADSMGIDAKDGMMRLIDALSSGREQALRQLGVVLDLDKANRDYAESNGIVGRELSANEKKLALQLAAYDKLGIKVKEMPPAQEAVVDKWEQFQVKLGDVVEQIGKGINENENLIKALGDLGIEVDGISWEQFGQDIGDVIAYVVDIIAKIKSLGGTLYEFAQKFGYTTKQVEGSKIATKEFGTNFNTVNELMTGGRGALTKLGQAQEDYNKKVLEATVGTEEYKQALEKEKKALAEKREALKKEAEAAKKAKEAAEAKKKADEEAAAATKENAKKALDAISQLDEAYREFYRNLNAQHLASQMALKATTGNVTEFRELKNQLTTSIYEGLREGFIKNGGVLNDEAIVKMTRQAGDMAREEASKIVAQFGIKNNILGGLFGEYSPDQLAAKTAQQNLAIAQTLENTIASAITTGFEKGFNSDTIKQLISGLGSSLGSIFGGPIGGALGGGIGSIAGDRITKIGKGTDVTRNSLETLFGIFKPSLTIPSKLAFAALGGSKSPQEEALAGLDKWIEERLSQGPNLGFSGIDTGSFSGGGDWASQFWGSFDEKAVSSFSSLGEALRQIAGVGEDVGGQLGFVLANNLNGNLDQARMLLMQMGIGAQDLEQAFMQIGLTGEETWHTVETYMQSINDLTGEGLVGIGDLEGAMTQFIESGGRGQEALIALRNLGIEAMEAGAASMLDLRGALEATGKYTTEQISAIMTALSQRGISSLEQLSDASDRELGGVTADAESLGFVFEDSIAKGVDKAIKNVKELDRVINQLPEEIEKKIILKVETQYSGDDARSLYADIRNSPGVARG